MTSKKAVACQICGSRVLRFPSQVRARVFCSRACAGRGQRGSLSPTWKGGRSVHPEGYIYIGSAGRAHGRLSRNIAEHIVVAERALGKRLPPKAEVHHFNRDTSDNQPRNLVICQNRLYHELLECRTDRLREFGNPNVKRCVACREVLPLDSFHINTKRADGRQKMCKACIKRRNDLFYNNPEVAARKPEELVGFICPMCGKEFVRHIMAIRRARRATCGRSCGSRYGKIRSEDFVVHR